MRLAALGLPSTHWATHAMQHDMTLMSRGVFSIEDPPPKHLGDEKKDVNGDLTLASCSSRKDGSEHDNVRLPLKPALTPAALRPDADLESLKELVEVKFKYTGMWEPTTGAEKILEACV